MKSRLTQRRAVWRVLWTAFWIALGAVFFLFGLWMRGQVVAHGASEVMGYDYATFMSQFRDPAWMTYTGARHPGLGLLMSPVVMMAKFLCAAFGGTAADVMLHAVFAAVAAINVWLVWRIGGIAAAALFLSFSFVWLLASVPESFPIAMFSLLVTLLFVKSASDGMKSHPAPWIALFCLCSAVTVTNGLKVLTAYLIVNRPSRRRLVLLGAFAAGAALLGAGFFALRMMRWNMQHPEATKTVCGALAQTASWIPQGLGVCGRLKLFAMNFLALPVQPWKGLGNDAVSGLSLPLTVGWLGGGWAAVIYAATAAGAWICRHDRVVQVLFGMFAVDLAIHLMCGWGLSEGWLFCAHWFFLPPVCIGLGLRRALSAHRSRTFKESLA